MGVEAKICGLTRPRDAALAVRLGASRLGVVFAGGPRHLTWQQAAAIVAEAGETPVVGVFGTQNAEQILELAGLAGLRGAQLHGAGSPARADQLRKAGLEVWGVATLDEASTVAARIASAAHAADIILVEPRLHGGSGGRGVPLATALIQAARMATAGRRLALAGGLRPETLAAAIQIGNPDLVDVSSGVEMEPGVKDPDRLARFLEIARDARPPA